MLENYTSVREHYFNNINNTLGSWLHERQDMLVRYCALSNVDATVDQESMRVRNSVRELCEIMMDYVSAGHFKVYEELLRESREGNNTDALAQADQLYAVVEKTTDSVLDFNDKYQEVDDLSSLAADLSRLGEQLATRFEAEDGMIALMQLVQQDPVA